MTDYKYFEASPQAVTSRAFWPMVFAILLADTSFLVTGVKGLSLLSGIDNGVEMALALSDSAKVFGISLITLVLVAVLGTRRRLSVDYRLKEAIAVIGTVIVFAGGGAMLNEHFVKTRFETPRPNVVWLAEQPTSVEMGFTTEAYYARAYLDDRSGFMKRAAYAANANVPRIVADHWASEPGYSFPSGHAYASFFIATFFLFFATSFVSSSRQLIFYLLVPWAALVSLSRVLLHVHRPIDITVGAVQGLIVGILAWLFVRTVIRKLVQLEIGS